MKPILDRLSSHLDVITEISFHKSITRLVGILIIPVSLLFFSGCAKENNAVNPLSGNWSWAEGTVDQSVKFPPKKFTPIADESLKKINECIPGKKGFIWLKNEFDPPKDITEQQVFYLGRILCADITYFNGSIIGSTGRFPPNFYNEWISFRYYPVSERDIIAGKNTLLIKIYVNEEGSLPDVPTFGKASVLNSQYSLDDFMYRSINAITSIILIVFGLYHLFMFLKRRKDKENLYFGLMGISVSIYFSNFFITKMPGFIDAGVPYIFMQKIFFPVQFIAAFSMASFIREFLRQKDPLWLRSIIYLCAFVPPVAMMFMPNNDYGLFYRTCPIFQVTILPIIIYTIYHIVLALLKKSHEAKILILGTLPLAITMVLDILIHQVLFRGTKIIYFTPFGFPLFFLAILFILANRFMNDRNEVEYLNINLEKKVSDRTEELQAAMTEMEAMNEQLIETRDALWGEMELAKKIQMKLLPENPSMADYEIAAYMRPADEVGGDYYDIINVADIDWVVIGDVSGHGVPAGLVMMMVQTAIHITLDQNADIAPENLLTIINKTIAKNIRRLGENKIGRAHV